MKYLLSGNSLFVVVNGRPHSITSDHAHFSAIVGAVVKDEPEDVIESLFDRAVALNRYMAGQVTNDGGTLFFKGMPVHGVVADRILDFMAKGMPYQPLVKFLERLLANPSKRSVDELYGFIEANKMPITEDGFVLGYKGISADYKDQYSGTLDYHIGAKVPRLERNQVDDNWRTLCSNGYHIGSKDYAVGWGARTIIVKFDPADAISVPDAGEKLRVCFFEIVGDYGGELPAHVAISKRPYAKDGFVLRVLRKLFGARETTGCSASGVGGNES